MRKFFVCHRKCHARQPWHACHLFAITVIDDIGSVGSSDRTPCTTSLCSPIVTSLFDAYWWRTRTRLTIRCVGCCLADSYAIAVGLSTGVLRNHSSTVAQISKFGSNAKGGGLFSPENHSSLFVPISFHTNTFLKPFSLFA